MIASLTTNDWQHLTSLVVVVDVYQSMSCKCQFRQREATVAVNPVKPILPEI